MINALTLLPTLQLIGEVLSGSLGLPAHGPVIGMGINGIFTAVVLPLLLLWLL